MKHTESSAGGYIVLFALVTILALPLAAGHFMAEKQPPVTVHAEASSVIN